MEDTPPPRRTAPPDLPGDQRRPGTSARGGCCPPRPLWPGRGNHSDFFCIDTLQILFFWYNSKVHDCIFPFRMIIRACSAAGSASHSHCGGRRFESDQVHQSSENLWFSELFYAITQAGSEPDAMSGSGPARHYNGGLHAGESPPLQSVPGADTMTAKDPAGSLLADCVEPGIEFRQYDTKGRKKHEIPGIGEDGTAGQ